MTRLFVHQPLFRMLSPLLSGTVVYLLILLINNNVAVLDQLFLGQELYFCIAQAYLIQETSRYTMVVVSRASWLSGKFWRIVLPALTSSVLTILLITGSMYGYYRVIIGFSPIVVELVVFNSIFVGITWIYLILFISHDLLRQSHELYLLQEKELKEQVQQDFLEFKQGINADLLFESLEQLLLLSKVDLVKADEFLDQLAIVYRYVLSRKKELVQVGVELEALKHFIDLLHGLPNRVIVLTEEVKSTFLVVPGVLLKLVEMVVRRAVSSPKNEIHIALTEKTDRLLITISLLGKLATQRKADEAYAQLKDTYVLYAEAPMQMKQENNRYEFVIPKLTMAP